MTNRGLLVFVVFFLKLVVLHLINMFWFKSCFYSWFLKFECWNLSGVSRSFNQLGILQNTAKYKRNFIVRFFARSKFIIRQNVHGPDRSPEKTVQSINIQLYQLEKKYTIIFFLRIECFLNWTNLNPFHPVVCCAKFGWNWYSGSEEDF